MGKKQHQSDKMYITHKEWSTLFGGKRVAQGQMPKEFRRLPFDCCAVTFQPFDHPVCDDRGNVFDLVNIVPFVKRHGVNPVTGEKLDINDLTRLHFHKNAEGKYHCPVSFKVFNENTHISAVKKTGNVYATDAIQKFNIKAKYWKDLLTDEPFTRKDVITIQDPTSLDKYNMQTFHHLKAGLSLKEEKAKREQDPSFYIRTQRGEAAAVMDELKKTKSEWQRPELGLTSNLSSTASSAPKDKARTAAFSTGEMSRSFTSTHLTPRTINTAETIDELQVKYSSIKEKGYVMLHTNVGDINLQLHCDIAPKTCDNFLRLCEKGYYTGTIFHRNIKHFMIQGGDPTGSGRGGESAFEGGKSFADEFMPQLLHDGRGILSMANSGPDTNKSQFFITYRQCPSLDRKHTVFGQVVGNMATLDTMERTETDDSDRPKKELKIDKVTVYTNPFTAYEQKLEEEKKAAEEDGKKAKKRAAVEPLKPVREGVGKYLKMPRKGSGLVTAAGSASGTGDMARRKKAKKSGFGDFSAW
eukprot:m.484440 g.484440  ORF g.484440 m.484440 type:complete len:526 (+) comp23351_c0_seq1:235-1812(+)